MSSQLSLVTILARDMSRTKAFYTELLGFEVVPAFSSPAGDFVFLRSKTGNVDIALQDVAKKRSRWQLYPDLSHLSTDPGNTGRSQTSDQQDSLKFSQVFRTPLRNTCEGAMKKERVSFGSRMTNPE